MKLLQPCPRCGKEDYSYGFSLIALLSETALAALPLLSQGISTLAVGRIIASGGSNLGIFSVPKVFWQGVVEGVPDSPLLRCNCCQSLV